MQSNRLLRIFAVIALLAVLTACAPEGQREAGGGPGGDIGNVAEDVNMHGEDDAMTRIFYETPRIGLGVERSRDARADDDES